MDIIEIANKINNIGGSLYLVGGALRDEFLNIENHDKDYCVTGISKDEFLNLFPNAKIQGKSFEVFTINNTEFALARKERKIGLGHKKFKVETHKNITIQEDLARRDITINSIAKNVLTGEIIDPFNGIQDIKNKIIRATTNAFSEDPLRVYRVARFAAKLEFEVDKNTIILMNKLKDELNTLSKERVFTEFRKALNTNKPSIFFNVLRKAGVLDIHFKEINDLIGIEQPIKYHPEGDAYNHTMLVLDNACNLTKNEVYRYCALVHDLGKGVTPKEILPHHYGHDARGVKLVENLSNRLKTPQIWKDCGKVSAKEHMKGGIFKNMKPATKVTFIERIEKSKLGLEGLQIVVNADRLGKQGENEKELEFLEIGKRCIKSVDGDFIKKKYNIEEGIQLKQKLHEERINWLKNY